MSILYGTGIWTDCLQNMSLHPLPLDQGFPPYLRKLMKSNISLTYFCDHCITDISLWANVLMCTFKKHFQRNARKLFASSVNHGYLRTCHTRTNQMSYINRPDVLFHPCKFSQANKLFFVFYSTRIHITADLPILQSKEFFSLVLWRRNVLKLKNQFYPEVEADLNRLKHRDTLGSIMEK